MCFSLVHAVFTPGQVQGFCWFFKVFLAPIIPENRREVVSMLGFLLVQRTLSRSVLLFCNASHPNEVISPYCMHLFALIANFWNSSDRNIATIFLIDSSASSSLLKLTEIRSLGRLLSNCMIRPLILEVGLSK